MLERFKRDDDKGGSGSGAVATTTRADDRRRRRTRPAHGTSDAHGAHARAPATRSDARRAGTAAPTAAERSAARAERREPRAADRRGDEDRAVAPARGVRRPELGRELLRLARGRRRRRDHHRPAGRGGRGGRAHEHRHRRRRVHRAGRRPRAAGGADARLLLRRLRRGPDVALRRRPPGHRRVGHRPRGHASCWPCSPSSPATSTTCSSSSGCRRCPSGRASWRRAAGSPCSPSPAAPSSRPLVGRQGGRALPPPRRSRRIRRLNRSSIESIVVASGRVARSGGDRGPAPRHRSPAGIAMAGSPVARRDLRSHPPSTPL